jgi:hypothetical protein
MRLLLSHTPFQFWNQNAMVSKNILSLLKMHVEDQSDVHIVTGIKEEFINDM